MLRFPFRWIASVATSLVLLGAAVAQQDVRPLARIAFGSCADQDKPLPIFDAILKAQPDLLLMLGDNIYADITTPRNKVNPDVIKAAYETLGKLPAWQRLRETVPMLAIWDDHDYGINDAGEEWKFKDESKQLMLDFFGVPADAPRRSRPGAYAAAIVGPPGQRVQVILLDTRYFRSKLSRADQPGPGMRVPGYIPNTEPDATVLGAEQWKWLEEQLKKPAEVRLLCSSIQVVVDDHPFEKWSNFPKEREKLFQLIRDTGAKGVIVLSGDRHLGDLSVDAKAVGYPLYDLTSSGLNQGSPVWRAPEPNKYRVGGMPWGNNFGMIEIDWSAIDPLISMNLLDEKGQVRVKETIPLSLLVPKEAVPPKVPLSEGVIGPLEANKKKAGDEVVIQFEVKNGRRTETRFFLNSEKDFRSEDNFTVLIVGKALKQGKWAGAKEENFIGKTIRVKGVISEYNNRPQLQVDDENNLEIVGE